MMEYSAAPTSSFWRRMVLTPVSAMRSMVSSSRISPRSTSGTVLSMGMTSPVSSSSKSSVQVLRTLAARARPAFCLRVSSSAEISSASPKMSMMSLSEL